MCFLICTHFVSGTSKKKTSRRESTLFLPLTFASVHVVVRVRVWASPAASEKKNVNAVNTHSFTKPLSPRRNSASRAELSAVPKQRDRSNMQSVFEECVVPLPGACGGCPCFHAVTCSRFILTALRTAVFTQSFKVVCFAHTFRMNRLVAHTAQLMKGKPALQSQQASTQTSRRFSASRRVENTNLLLHAHPPTGS